LRRPRDGGEALGAGVSASGMGAWVLILGNIG
jgi:hypothetical protein